MPSATNENEATGSPEVPREEFVDQEMADGEFEFDAEIDPNKIQILPGASEDGTAASFRILQEDHTLGNALRYMIMKNPEVEFCGYSIPHPSEAAMNLRIQTYGEITAIQALEKGLDDLLDLCSHIEDEYRKAVEAGNYSTIEP
ncbi:DNA-directed RNA polymerase [Lipomyces chichibuensis]|uniref:DNA-directed RNA polymerase n=1 Tax=Lipomyces chichibuensis TaxID=1546026 RepID=UPI003343D2B2